jgi:YbbR domain-containing protein
MEKQKLGAAQRVKKVLGAVAAFFLSDVHWKLLSLLLAVALWFVGVNVNNPMITEAYTARRLDIVNADYLLRSGVVLLNEQELLDTRIDVSVRATRNDHNNISAREGNVQASIDLRRVDLSSVLASDIPVRVTADVEVDVLHHFDRRTYRPHTVELVLDRYTQADVPVLVDITGTPREGYENTGYTCSNTVVRLSGAKSALENVGSVRARVDVHDAEVSVDRTAPLVVYDRNLVDITHTVSVNVREVRVTVQILPYESKPVEVWLVGNPQPGFTVTQIEYSPSEVQLVGSREALLALPALALGEVDITGANETIVEIFDARRALTDPALSLRAYASPDVAVTVTIEQVITRELYMPLEAIIISGTTREYSFPEAEPVRILLRGRASVLRDLSVSDINARLDLTGLGAGTHNVPLHLSLPQGVSLTAPATVDITIAPERAEPGDTEPDY